MCDGFEPARTADSRQHRFGHAFGNAPSYLDMGKSNFKHISAHIRFEQSFENLPADYLCNAERFIQDVHLRKVNNLST